MERENTLSLQHCVYLLASVNYLGRLMPLISSLTHLSEITFMASGTTKKGNAAMPDPGDSAKAITCNVPNKPIAIPFSPPANNKRGRPRE